MSCETTLSHELRPVSCQDKNNPFLVNFQTVDYFVRRNYLPQLSQCKIKPFAGPFTTNNIRLFHIDRIIFDEKEDRNEKLTSVFSALYTLNVTVYAFIRGTTTGVDVYLGARGDSSAGIPGDVLRQSFLANFPGSSLTNQDDDALRNLLENQRFDNISSVTVVPSQRKDNEKDFVQGLEKLIDTMQGKNYTAMFIASPVNQTALNKHRLGLEQLYSVISPYGKTTYAYGENQSEAVSKGTFQNFTATINEGISNTVGRNESYSENKSSGSTIAGFSSSKGKSYSVGESTSETTNKGTAESRGSGTNENKTITTGNSLTLTKEAVDKTAENLLAYIDEQFERIKAYESFGVWETAAYFCSAKVEDSIVAANTFRAMVLGDESSAEYSCINRWNAENGNMAVAQYLQYCQHPQFIVKGHGSIESRTVTAGNFVSAKDLPIFMSLPQKSVSGLPVTTMAEFGRNVAYRKGATKQTGTPMSLGCVHHMGKDEETNCVAVNPDTFTSHCFICGSTGSGKSNTTHYLLQRFAAKKTPFLVVEPTKGEYKEMFGGMEDINIFHTNPYMGAMLKINPFSFPPQIHVLEHLDRLIEIFNACWEMYAAMPAILRSAVEKSYVRKGWDLENSVYLYGGEPKFPTFEDVLSVLPQIIRSSSYSADTKGDYTGALVTRVESLTNGITGQIFCDKYHIPDSVLFDESTIVDLSRVGSAETKSLIMGILVMRLNEYRIANATGNNQALKHITVLEEAHHLLKNVSQTQGQQTANPVGKSVEMICNAIAEMRTYGEGFIIVDQSPSSVDIAAIKNTNTKIAMRLPEKNDCEAIGNSLGLNEAQTKELSRLPVGVAVVIQSDWLEAVLCKIEKAQDKYNKIHQPISYEALKTLRSAVVESLIASFATTDRIDVEAVSAVVDTVSIDEAIKREMRNRIVAVAARVNERKDVAALHETLVHISGIYSTMSRFEDNVIGQEDNAGTVNVWKTDVLASLRQLLAFSLPNYYEALFKSFVLHMRAQRSRVNYSLIFNTLYPKG